MTIQEVPLNKLHLANLEIPDEFPYPPPPEFTWQHYTMLTGLQKQTNEIIEICAEVASRWVQTIPHASADIFRNHLLYGIRVLEDSMQNDFVIHLLRCANRVQRLRSKMKKMMGKAPPAGFQLAASQDDEALHICRAMEFRMMDTALSELERTRGERFMKRFCCQCGIVLGRRSCSKCSICYSVRYCSAECQRNHWPRHKEVCGKVEQRLNS